MEARPLSILIRRHLPHALMTACALAAAAPLAVATAAPSGPVLVSRQDPSAGGAPSDGEASDVSLSRDGRLIAFASSATNLGGQGSGARDDHVFLHDRLSGATTLASPPGQLGYAPAISGDGRTLVFLTAPRPLTDGDVYLRDVPTGSLQIIGHGSAGDGRGYPQGPPRVSADGRIVAYGARVASGSYVVRVFDRRTGRTRTLAPPDRGQPTGLSVSADGHVVAWSLEGGGASVAKVTVFRYDLRRHRRRRVARFVCPASLSGYGPFATSLSRTGRWLAYVRWFGPPTLDRTRNQVVLEDGRTHRRVVASRYAGHATGGTDPNLSGDGRRLVFRAATPILRDLRTGRTTVLPVATPIALADGGRWLAYSGTSFPRQAFVLALP